MDLDPINYHRILVILSLLMRNHVGQAISPDAGLFYGLGYATEGAVRARRCQSMLESFAARMQTKATCKVLLTRA